MSEYNEVEGIKNPERGKVVRQRKKKKKLKRYFTKREILIRVER